MPIPPWPERAAQACRTRLLSLRLSTLAGLFCLSLPVFVLLGAATAQWYLALIGPAAVALLCGSVRLAQKKPADYSLAQFKAHHPNHFNVRSGKMACPFCECTSQQCCRTRLKTLAQHPFFSNTLEVRCSQCERLLIVDEVQGYYSPAALAGLSAPHQHVAGRPLQAPMGFEAAIPEPVIEALPLR